MTATAEIAIPRDAELTSASLTLPAVLPAAREARTFTAKALRRWGEGEELIEAAVLIVSELATNAIRHGGRLPAGCRERGRGRDAVITLRLVPETEALHIEVHDGSALLPVQRTAGRDEDCGRGMLIVDALADSWSCGPAAEGGKWVRATVSRTGR
ncbi:ATP-binding protein [Streptomyces sp. DSM 41528]|uniref:ATP-binding protein n=2 Tax=Streptomyces bugieae TaxID=3098223 RepID=A0ABU7NK01_9ACTN|nr:ATP-binding protein [Streptomyces sp. DSM 41528]